MGICKWWIASGVRLHSSKFLIEVADHHLLLNTREGNVFGWNTAARSLYAKLSVSPSTLRLSCQLMIKSSRGFVEEGCKREHHFYNGRWQDTIQV